MNAIIRQSTAVLIACLVGLDSYAGKRLDTESRQTPSLQNVGLFQTMALAQGPTAHSPITPDTQATKTRVDKAAAAIRRKESSKEKFKSVDKLVSIVISRDPDVTLLTKASAIGELLLIGQKGGRSWENALQALRILQIMARSGVRGLGWTKKFIADSILYIEDVSGKRLKHNVFFQPNYQEGMNPNDVLSILRAEVETFKQTIANSKGGKDSFIHLDDSKIAATLPRGFIRGATPFTNLVRTILGNIRDTLEKTKSAPGARSSNAIISAHLTAKNKKIAISFQDHGSGIEAILLPHIFKGMSTKAKEGRGLGLQDADVIWDKHWDGRMMFFHRPTGIRIQVISEVGKKTVFKLYIDADLSEPLPSAPAISDRYA